MRIQVIFRLAALLMFLCLPAMGAEPKLCFDFNTKVAKPMKEPLALKPDADHSAFGKYDQNGVTWASLRGTVNKPVKQLLNLLLDHNTTKSPRVDEMNVVDLTSPHYLARHDVKFLIKPFPLIKVRWTEQWAYTLLSGSPDDPQEVLISYQKSEGTSHIEHLCGSVLLRKLGPNNTDVFQYEEAKATQRTPEDTLNGNIGTLKTLRK